MRRYLPQISFLFLLVTITFTSCEQQSTSSGEESFQSNLISGTWKISYYYEDYEDKTSQLADFVFSFSDNGNLLAKKPGYTSNGTWSYDSEDEELHIAIGAEKPLSDLTDSYLVISSSSTEIKLREYITSKDCFLTFTRN
jgi:hypothetical protein